MAKLQRFETQLLALNQQIKRTLAQSQLASAPVELDQNRLGRLSRMDAMQGQAMAQAGHARQKVILDSIALALKKIPNGEYGRCEECDDWIVEARLSLDPASVYCVSCATKMEAK